MKRIVFITLIVFTLTDVVKSQLNYCDFEGSKFISFGPRTGTLDTMATNPARNMVDSSNYCAKYIRSAIVNDNLSLHTNKKLIDVGPYANDTQSTLKIQVKLFSTAPIGTPVVLQLGIQALHTYPEGIYAEFSGTTKAQNEWELFTFDYVQIPVGSQATATSIDKIVVLFNPNSTASDTFYFDDPTGPDLFEQIGIAEVNDPSPFELLQNYPNPAKQNTHLNFQLNTSGRVSIQLYNILGAPVSSILDENIKAGTYSIPIETSNLADGIYFYVLKKDGFSKTMKMTVLK